MGVSTKLTTRKRHVEHYMTLRMTDTFWNTLCSILESKPGIRQPFFEVDNERSLGDLKRYTWNVLRVHDAWLAPSEPQFCFRTLKSFNLWRRTEVLPGGRWFGIDNDLKALMVDLDSGTHYGLLKLHHPQYWAGLLSFQLSFKEGVRSSFRVALFDPTSWEGGEWNDFGFMTFSIINLLQKYHASAFIKSTTWLIAILCSNQPI